MEEESSSIVQLFTDFTSNNNNVRSQADNKIQELINDDPNSFSEMMIDVLQDYQNHSLNTILLCFIFLRKIFSRATHALKTNDDKFSYCIIPQDSADSYIPLILSFFSNEDDRISFGASYLLGQLAIYLLTFDENNPIFSILIDQIEEGQSISPFLKSIHFILFYGNQLIESNHAFQHEFMNKLQNWLCDENFPFESKPILIQIITLLIPFLSNILLNPEDNESFNQMMLEVTQVPEFKCDSYDFWLNLESEVPELLINSNSSLAEISIKDLEDLLSKYPNLDESDEALVFRILDFWTSFICVGKYDPESTSKIFDEIIPSFLPFLLQNAETFIDPTILDEGFSVFIFLCDVICEISFTYFNLSFPILIKYGLQAIESEEIKEKITGFYTLNMIVTCYEYKGNSIKEEEDEEEYNEEFLSFCTQCVSTAMEVIESEIDFKSQTENSRLMAQAIELIFNIVCVYPDLIDYINLIPRLVELMRSPLQINSRLLIVQIIENEHFESSDLIEIINALLDTYTYEAINCVWKILNINYYIINGFINADLLDQIYPQIISIIEGIIESNTTDEHIYISLTPLLQIVYLAIDLDHEIITSNYENFIQTIISCYENYENSESVRILSFCAKTTEDAELIHYISEQIIYQLDNQDDPNMISACLNSLIYDLNSVDLSSCFSDLIRSLFEHQEFTRLLLIKIMILEVFNSLHESFPLLMQPYLTRLVSLFGSAIVCFDDQNIDESKEKFLEQLLKASLLFLQNVLQESEEFEQCFQIASRSVQCFFYTDYHNNNVILILFDLLNEMIQKNPVLAKDVLKEERLNQYIQYQAEQMEDSSSPSLESIIQFLSQN